MKKLILICFLVLSSASAFCQDLNARVQLLYPNIQNPNKRLFDMLEKSIQDFVSGRKWSSDPLKPQERIDCNFVITITSWDGSSNYNAEAQIQSSRPIFGSSYNSIILNISDKDFNFTYSEGQPLDFSDQNYLNNLTSLLAFYSYIITGLDYDTFSKYGGTQYFTRAQTVLNNAQNSGNKGWRAFESFRNRYWLIENLTNKSYNPIREALYDYHRNGLDYMAENVSKGRKSIFGILPDLQKIDKQKQGTMLPQLFFTAKADELISIFSQSDPQERMRAYNLLTELDPPNSSKYDALKKSN